MQCKKKVIEHPVYDNNNNNYGESTEPFAEQNMAWSQKKGMRSLNVCFVLLLIQLHSSVSIRELFSQECRLLWILSSVVTYFSGCDDD